MLLPYVYVAFMQVRGINHIACTLKAETGTTLEAITFNSKDIPLEQAFKNHKSTPAIWLAP